jgi:hypothetical protein
MAVREDIARYRRDQARRITSTLISQLIRDHWQQRRPAPSITEQLGGHPDPFLDTQPAGSAERQERHRLLSEQLQARRLERR